MELQINWWSSEGLDPSSRKWALSWLVRKCVLWGLTSLWMGKRVVSALRTIVLLGNTWRRRHGLCPQGACDMHEQKQETTQDRTGNVRLSSCMEESGEGSSVRVVWVQSNLWLWFYESCQMSFVWNAVNQSLWTESVCPTLFWRTVEHHPGSFCPQTPHSKGDFLFLWFNLKYLQGFYPLPRLWQPSWSDPVRAYEYLTSNHQIGFRGKDWETGCWGLNNKNIMCPMLSPLSGNSVLLYAASPKKYKWSWEKEKTLRKERGVGMMLSGAARCSRCMGLAVLLWSTDKRPVTGLCVILPLLSCSPVQWGHRVSSPSLNGPLYSPRPAA